jgi:hypothetical protein
METPKLAYVRDRAKTHFPPHSKPMDVRVAYLPQFVNERIQNELAGYGDQAYIFHEALNAAPCRLDLGKN